MNVTRDRKRQKGFVLMFSGLMLTFIIIPTVGLAIDVGVVYAIKAKLQTAVDGAALAAARGLSRGLTLSSQDAAAAATAQRFFQANVYNGYLGMSNPQAQITFPPAPPKTKIIDITAEVQAPTYFMRILGVNSLRVTAVGSATRRDVNIVMVVDRSNSLDTAGACDDLRESAKAFVEAFVDGRDRIGLITFGTSYRVDFAPAMNFRTANPNVITHINNLNCAGWTNSAAAYWEGYQRLRAINEPGTLNVLLFFTDGQPNTITLDLEVIPGRCGGNNTLRRGVLAPGNAGSGLYQIIASTAPPVPDPDTTVASSMSGCAAASNPSNVESDLRMRTGTSNEVDVNGNSFNGYKTPVRRSSGRIRINDEETIENIGINALDNAAQRVRSESATNGLEVVTYCIGLGGPGQAEDRLLQRIANVPESDIYDPTKPRGMYIYAENASQLQMAFASLASDILRISR
ncbi:MAG: VWA domain-containing protein [Bryobacteraceae bacterium]|nr:VWA domain-containing protein [Bryobacteraceae bacterium]MDW8377383.1 VWA domain-containing protein [Bryobacterales bacterium]